MSDAPKAKGEDLKARKAALLAEKAAKALAQEEADDRNEIAILELEAKYEDALGPRGQQFEIVDLGDLGERPIVVKLTQSVVIKRYRAAVDKAGRVTEEAVDALVKPCLEEPSIAEYAEIIERRPVVAYRCMDAVTTLFGGRDKSSRGKF